MDQWIDYLPHLSERTLYSVVGGLIFFVGFLYMARRSSKVSIGDLQITFEGNSQIIQNQMKKISDIARQNGLEIKLLGEHQILIINPDQRCIDELGKLPVDLKKIRIDLKLLPY